MDNKKKTILIVISAVGLIVAGICFGDFIRRHPSAYPDIDYTAEIPFSLPELRDAVSFVVMAAGFGAFIIAGGIIEVQHEKEAEEKEKRRSGKSRNTRSAYYGYGYEYADDNDTGDENSNPTEFIRPWGIVPDPIDPQRSFTDMNGHRYNKVAGTWYDENWNIAPGYLNDYYGLTAYDEKYGSDDD